MKRNSRTARAIFVMMLGSSSIALGQGKLDPAKIHGSESATVEKIMEQAVRNIAMRYNLNPAQTTKTTEIMTRRVQDFLREHENEVWPVIRDLLSHQLGNKVPDNIAEAMRIGRSARPLIQLAKEAIFKGNEEWRQYLSPEQQRTHDYDLAQMDKTFQTIEKNFDQWAEGKPSKGLFPGPPPVEQSPPRPAKPAGRLPTSTVDVVDPYRIFSIYVEEFITKYDLTEGQIDSVRSILVEFRRKANDFTLNNRVALEQINIDSSVAKKEGNHKKLVLAESKRKQLLKPIYSLFSQLVQRSEALLTTSQRQQFEQMEQPVIKKSTASKSKDVDNTNEEDDSDIPSQPNEKQAKKGDNG